MLSSPTDKFQENNQIRRGDHRSSAQNTMIFINGTPRTSSPTIKKDNTKLQSERPKNTEGKNTYNKIMIVK